MHRSDPNLRLLFRDHFAVLFGSVLGLLLLGGCVDNTRPSGVEELEFQIQDSLLAPSVFLEWADLRISPPRSFVEADSASFGKYQRLLEIQTADSTAFSENPRETRIFHDSASGAVLIVSSVRSAIHDVPVWERYNEHLKKVLGTQAATDTFLKDEMLFTQFLIRTPNRVQFKLLTLLDSSTAAQFDYIIPEDVYPSYIRSIESSIGSISRSSSTT